MKKTIILFAFSFIINFCFAQINLSFSSLNPSCTGFSDGSIDMEVSGDTIPYTVNWFIGLVPIASSEDILNLAAGQYIVVVADSLVSITDTITLIDPIILSTTSSFTDPLCTGSCDGTATTVPSGGNGPYLYSWNASPIQSSPTAINLCADTFVVTIVDLNNCVISDTVELVDPTPLASSTIGINANCYGICDGKAVNTTSGGTGSYTYFWNTSPAQVSDTAFGLCIGPLYVSVTDSNGCSVNDTINLTEPTELTTATTFTNVSCNTLCDGDATTLPSGGTGTYTYSWSTFPIQLTPTANLLCADTFYVTVSDSNNCSIIDTIQITEPMVLSSSISSTNSLCALDSNGSATITLAGGTAPYTYSWSTSPVQTNPMAVGLFADTFYVSISDTNGCTLNDTIEFIDPIPLSTTTSSSNPLCYFSCDGSATTNPLGGTAPYTYLWNSSPIQTAPSAIGLCADTFIVSITDSIGCVINDTISLVDPTPLSTITSTINPLCTGSCDGTATTVPSGGNGPYLYSWNASPIQSSPTAINLCADTFVVTIVDLNNCVISDTIELIDPTPLSSSTIGINTNCYGICDGKAVNTTSGGTGSYTYFWNTSPAQVSDTAFGLCIGPLYVSVTDSNGCSVNDTINLTEPTELTTATTFTNVSCNTLCDGDATTLPSGGTGTYTYSWNTFPIQLTPTANLLCADTFYVTVSDSNNCSIIDTIQITEPIVLSSSISSINPLCALDSNGTATITLAGGTAPYTYSWSTSPVQTNPTAVSLFADTFYVSIIDTNGCTLNDTIELIDPIPLSTTTSSNNPLCYLSCDGGATTNPLGGTAPYTYLWNSSPIQTAPSAIGLCADTFIVIITDSNGCVVNDTISLVDPTPLSTITSTINPSCYGACDGTATTLPSGGLGAYSYSWNNAGFDSTATATGLCDGSFIVSVSDSNNCIVNDTILITEPIVITTFDTIIDAPCHNDYGVINITPSISSNSYTGTLYTLVYDPFEQKMVIDSNLTTSLYTNGSDTNQLKWSVLKGVYIVKVTENFGAGCEITINLQILEPSAPLSVTKTFVHNTCKGGSNAWINVAPEGGTPPYSYSWSSGQTSAQINALTEGYYDVQIRDDHNCSINVTTLIQEPFQDLILISDSGDVSCRDNHDGFVQILDIMNGLPPYSYLWSNGMTDNVITDLDSGLYSIIVTDGNNCSVSDTFQVNRLDLDCITIHNVITPDDNGKNDVWEITNIELYPNCDIAIFNRWGKKVFNTENGYDNSWDGKYKGELLNSGDYYYVINLNTGSYPPYTGPIKILK